MRTRASASAREHSFHYRCSNPPIARAVPCGRTRRNGARQRFDFTLPAHVEHRGQPLIEMCRELCSGIHHKIPRRQSSRAGHARMPRRDRRTGKKRDRDRAQQLRPSEMRARGIEMLAPPSQLGNGKRGQQRIERIATGGVERRLVEEWLGERAQVQPRAAHNEWRAPFGTRFFYPHARRLRPARRRVALRRLRRHRCPYAEPRAARSPSASQCRCRNRDTPDANPR